MDLTLLHNSDLKLYITEKGTFPAKTELMNSCSDTTSSCGTASVEEELVSITGSCAGGSEDVGLTGEEFVLLFQMKHLD